MPSRKGQLSGRLSGGRPGSRHSIAIALGILAVLLLSSAGYATGAGPSPPVSGPSSPWVIVGTLSDNQQIYLKVGGVNHTLSDSIGVGSLTPSLRSYEIVIQTNLPLAGDAVALSTSPGNSVGGPVPSSGRSRQSPAASRLDVDRHTRRE